MRVLCVVMGVGFVSAGVSLAGAPNRVTIAAAPRVVVYGGAVALSGTVTPARTGEPVMIAARPAGSATYSVTASVRTDASGTWHTSLRPALATEYRASRQGTRSGGVAVAVRPRVSLRRLSPHRFFVAVSAARSFSDRIVVLQRKGAMRWVTVARSKLDATAIARLRVSLPQRRSILRAYVPRAVTGYAAGHSAPLAVRA